jgi:hypothetical protein
VVKVHDQYFADLVLERTEVSVTTPVSRSGHWRDWLTDRGRGSRRQRDRRKGQLAGYLRTHRDRVPAEEKTESQLTGHCRVRLAGLDGAKRFRTREAAKRACELVRSMYGSLDIKITIETQEEEST